MARKSHARRGRARLNQPGDSLEVGADLIKPVGDYEVPNRFQGVIKDLEITYQRN